MRWIRDIFFPGILNKSKDTTYQQSKVPNGASDPVQVWEPVDPDPGSDYVSQHFLSGIVFGDGDTHVSSLLMCVVVL